MKTIGKSVALAGGLAIAALLVGTPSARAQGFGFGLSVPGVSVGVNTGGFGYYGGAYGGYPVVARRPLTLRPWHPMSSPGRSWSVARFMDRARTLTTDPVIMAAARIGPIPDTGAERVPVTVD